MPDDSGLEPQLLQAPASSLCGRAGLPCSENLQDPNPTSHPHTHGAKTQRKLWWNKAQSSAIVECNLAGFFACWASYPATSHGAEVRAPRRPMTWMIPRPFFPGSSDPHTSHLKQRNTCSSVWGRVPQCAPKSNSALMTACFPLSFPSHPRKNLGSFSQLHWMMLKAQPHSITPRTTPFSNTKLLPSQPP